MTEAIIVDNLGKRFSRYHAEKPVTIMEAVLSGLRRLKPLEEFWALRHVSFTVARGEMVGVIGHNGAGKSTLLQLIGGVGHIDEGRVRVNGRIGALLDLGAGFHTDLTGRENVFVSAVIAGLTTREVSRRFDDIVSFAELEQAIDNPLRTYSTGMQMRLAFSIAVHTNPDVLLVDEYLSVGDLSFQAKCLRRIMDLKEQGCAIVLISHSPEQIQDLCDQAIWLRQGQIVTQGTPDVVTGQYRVEMHAETQRRTPNRPPQEASSGIMLETNQNRFGSQEAEIQAVRLQPSSEIRSGDPLTVEVDYYAPEKILEPIVNVSITRGHDGEVCFDANTSTMGFVVENIHGKGTIVLELERIDLAQENYFVNVGLFKAAWDYAYDYHWEVYPLMITNSTNPQGILSPPGRWRVLH